MGWQGAAADEPDKPGEPDRANSGAGAGRGPAPGSDRGRDPRLAGFGADGKWDAARPSGALAGALEGASGPGWRCTEASADELAGLARQWQAVESWAAAGRLGVIRAMIRSQGISRAPETGDLPGEWSESLTHELALTLATSAGSADRMAWLAWQLEARLPGIGGLLADGKLVLSKAKLVADAFEWLTDDDAAEAEALILARLAKQPGLTWSQLAKLAARFAVQIDPEQAERRRKDAEQHEARVRMWREDSGAAGLMGSHLPADETLAAMAAVNARAEEYKASGAFGKAKMDQLRALAYLDLINAIPAQDRITNAKTTSAPPGQPAPAGPGSAPASDNGEEDDGGTGEDADPAGDGGPGNGGSGNGGGSSGGDPDGGSDGEPNAPSDPTARTDLIIPLATLLGRAERPGEAHGLGVLDPGQCRDLAATAANHPASQICVTVTDRDGFAIGHGCARAGRMKNAAAPRQETGPGPASLAALPARVNLTISRTALSRVARLGGQPGRAFPWQLAANDDDPGPPDGYGSWTLTLPGGRRLTVKLGPVPTHECNHRHESGSYTPSATLRHLVQVRDGECTFPPCSKHAHESDFEHARPYDKGGRTCACNAGARSRACHRVKQSPGWNVTQPKPGWHEWQTPAGRTYTQEPKRYPV